MLKWRTSFHCTPTSCTHCQYRSQPYLSVGAKWKNLPDFSPDFFPFFPTFSWFSPSLSQFLANFSLSRGTLCSPWPQWLRHYSLQLELINVMQSSKLSPLSVNSSFCWKSIKIWHTVWVDRQMDNSMQLKIIKYKRNWTLLWTLSYSQYSHPAHPHGTFCLMATPWLLLQTLFNWTVGQAQ